MRFTMRIAIALLVALPGLAFAHEPEGSLEFAGGIHPSRLAQIRIDGELSDWAWVPSTFVYERDEFNVKSSGVESGSISRDDFDVRLSVMWSPTTNMMYYGLQFTDDVFFSLGEAMNQGYAEDCFQFPTDPRHLGLLYKSDPATQNETAQQWVYSPDEQDFRLWAGDLEPEIAWATEPPYVLHAQTSDGASWNVEIAEMLWDRLRPGGEANSVVHELTPGEIMGWTVFIKDTDSQDDREQVRMSPRDGSSDASGFSDLMVVSVEDTEAEIDQGRYPLPTSVEQETWGAVKAAER